LRPDAGLVNEDEGAVEDVNFPVLQKQH